MRYRVRAVPISSAMNCKVNLREERDDHHHDPDDEAASPANAVFDLVRGHGG
jgi:hypothetical protein